MRFLPVFMDVTSGPVALVGAGEHAVNKLRLLLAAHATVRWYPRPHRRRRRDRAGGGRPGQARGRFPRSPVRQSRRRDRGRKRDRRCARRDDFRARPRGRHSGERGRPRRPFHLRVPGDRRSRRRGRGDRHRRSCAGAGAAPARAHRGDRARAHRRSRRADGPLSPPRGRGRAIAAAVLAEGRRRPDRRGGACRPLWCAPRPISCAASTMAAAAIRRARPAPCSWSAPARAIPIC